MSLPISQCLIVAAILNKKNAREALRARIAINAKDKHFILTQCLCSPRCVDKVTQSKADRFQIEEPEITKFLTHIVK